MKKESILHFSDTPFAFPKDTETLRVRLKSARGDLKACTVLYKDRYRWGTPFESVPLTKVCETELFDYYETELTLKTSRFLYFFRLEDTAGTELFYNERGFWRQQPAEVGAFHFPYIAKADLYQPPRWAQEGICYQIFPQSFCNGDRSNDPENAAPWGSPVGQGVFYGGDLQGILGRLPYLSELGVTFLYLTPIFLSNSTHKYNTDDYLLVDPHFGTVETLRELVSQCHKRGIRVVLDAVFNHCGEHFHAFQDVVKNGKSSKYRDWFYIDRFPVDTEHVNYLTFADGLRDMPKLNTSNPEVEDYLMRVAAYWMKQTGIDGWRLDVCDEVGHAFWKKFRTFVRSINPDAAIFGEIHHQSNAFLRGDEFDGIMNYPLYDAVLDFFAKRSIDAERFADEIASKRMLYPDAVNRSMLNLVDSHDTERFLTSCGGRKEQLKLAEVFQFTYLGIPYVYYGDEVGLSGGNDPACRKCMPWEPECQDAGLLEFYRKLIRIRKENPALVYGGYRQISVSPLFAFERVEDGGRIVVILNNSEKAGVLEESRLSGTYTDLWTGKDVRLRGVVEMKPDSFLILRPAREPAAWKNSQRKDPLEK